MIFRLCNVQRDENLREFVRSKETDKVLDLEGDTIATAQLAVDRHKEHRQVAPAPRDFEVMTSV
jgi:hypothetical protein